MLDDEAAQATTDAAGGGRRPDRRRSALSWTVAVLALAAALGAWLAVRARDADLGLLVRRAGELDLPLPAGGELARALAREADPGERRLVLARAALVAATSPAGGAPDVALLLARLDAAAEFAREALVRLPASADAPRLLGVATALSRLAHRDPRLLTEPAAWERPLEVARERAPDAEATERALAAVYVEIWPGLAGERRRRAESVLRAAFEDPDFRRRAFDRWLEVAGSIDRAEELLPDDSDTWSRLERAAVREGDLTRAAALHERGRQALDNELEDQLEEALARARTATEGRGDAEARAAIDRLLAAAPPDLRFAPWVERALARRPAGPGGPEIARAAERWLDWARPLCLVAGCPLSPAAFERLSGLAGAALPSETAAFAALAGGDRARAELLARRSDSLWSESWAPYLLLSARQRLEADDTAGARAALAEVQRPERRRLAWRRLARRAGMAPAGPEAETATAAESWQPTEWRYERGVPGLAFEAARPAAGLAIALTRPLPRPTLLVAEWDGRARAPLALAAGTRTLSLAGPVAPGAHLLRLTVLTGAAPEIGLTTLE
jgi:hypothetical protein